MQHCSKAIIAEYLDFPSIANASEEESKNDPVKGPNFPYVSQRQNKNILVAVKRKYPANCLYHL